MMEPGVGERDPYSVEAGRNGSRKVSGLLRKDYNRSTRGTQKLPFFLSGVSEKLDLVGLGQERERLGRATKSPPKLGHHLFPRSITGKMGSAQALDGQDFSIPQGFLRKKNWVSGDLLAAGNKQKLWATEGTGNGLGMVPPIQRVSVVPFAIRTHGKIAEGRARTIVGQSLHHREPRTTVRAACGPIPVKPTPRIVNVRKAPGAGGRIRGDEPRFLSTTPGGKDFEPPLAKRRKFLKVQAFNFR